MSRELQDASREKQKTSDLSSTLPLKKGSLSSFGSGACLLDPALLQEVLASPYEAMCAFLTITLHLKRAHGLPGPSSLDEMSQAVCKKIQAATSFDRLPARAEKLPRQLPASCGTAAGYP